MTETRRQRRLSFSDGDHRSSPTLQCQLCHHPHIDLSQPENWTSECGQAFAKNLGVSRQSLICTACRKDITRCIKDAKFKPRWVVKEVTTCSINECNVKVFSLLSTPKGKIESALLS